MRLLGRWLITDMKSTHAGELAVFEIYDLHTTLSNSHNNPDPARQYYITANWHNGFLAIVKRVPGKEGYSLLTLDEANAYVQKYAMENVICLDQDQLGLIHYNRSL